MARLSGVYSSHSIATSVEYKIAFTMGVFLSPIVPKLLLFFLRRVAVVATPTSTG